MAEVAALAAQLHTSVSKLHRAFAGEPASITEWIWARRLDAVRADLCDPALRHRTIGDLASYVVRPFVVTCGWYRSDPAKAVR